MIPRPVAQLVDEVAAVDWHWWAIAAVVIAAGWLIAEFLAQIFDSREPTGLWRQAPPDPADQVQTMGEQLAADLATARHVPVDEPTAIDLGVYALTPAVEQRAPVGPTPPLVLDLRPPSGEHPTVATQAPARLRAPWTGPQHSPDAIEHHAVPGGWRTGPDGLPVPIWMPDRLTGRYNDLVAREAASRETGEPPC